MAVRLAADSPLEVGLALAFAGIETVQLDRKGRPVVPFLAAWHSQCAWCLRLKHRDGRPHGQPLPKLRDHSHGICEPCFGQVMGGQA